MRSPNLPKLEEAEVITTTNIILRLNSLSLLSHFFLLPSTCNIVPEMLAMWLPNLPERWKKKRAGGGGRICPFSHLTNTVLSFLISAPQAARASERVITLDGRGSEHAIVSTRDNISVTSPLEFGSEESLECRL